MVIWELVTLPCKIKAIKGIIWNRHLPVPFLKELSTTLFSKVKARDGCTGGKWNWNIPHGPDWYFYYMPSVKICARDKIMNKTNSDWYP